VALQRLVVHPAQIQDTVLTLTPAQQHYLRRVLRLGVGDRFLALDGAGQGWLATLTEGESQGQLEAMPPPAVSESAPIALTLAAALPKQGFDEVVRQVTEIGVSRIVPILSDRTLLHPSPNKLQRWQRIAAEAAEQSERWQVPVVETPHPWGAWLQQAFPDPTHRLICVARGDFPSLLAYRLQHQPSAVVVATGPEGGWTAAEIEAAIAVGYQPVSLGSTILRAVTAPMVAAALLHSSV
jgi:16S rRNA (uracil1498-N3)-methyltransferase